MSFRDALQLAGEVTVFATAALQLVKAMIERRNGAKNDAKDRGSHE
jgi:hypothetical protein